jgi:23S rRNA pseudouridine1911/1915/1917 synthase
VEHPESDFEVSTLLTGIEAKGKRLDAWLAAQFDTVSRARIQALIAEGYVQINGTSIKHNNQKLKGTETITMYWPEPEPAEPEPQNIPLDIVYEDDAIIVINKPVGMVVHPAPGAYDSTLVNALLYHCGDSLSGIGGVKRPGIVHRLDKDTSGVMVVAKTDQAHKHLSAQFADHGRTGPMERLYHAIIWNTLPKPALTIDEPIGRDPHNRLKMAVRKNGREAITHIRQLENFYDNKQKPLSSFVECRLETGRTHQIRVHLTHIGCPLLGDPVYGTHYAASMKKLEEKAGHSLITRQALHATLLSLVHPVDNTVLTFQSEPPEDFANILKILR